MGFFQFPQLRLSGATFKYKMTFNVFVLLTPNGISDDHPPDPALAAEFGRLDGVLGPTSVTELPLHYAVVMLTIELVPEKGT